MAINFYGTERARGCRVVAESLGLYLWADQVAAMGTGMNSETSACPVQGISESRWGCRRKKPGFSWPVPVRGLQRRPLKLAAVAHAAPAQSRRYWEDAGDGAMVECSGVLVLSVSKDFGVGYHGTDGAEIYAHRARRPCAGFETVCWRTLGRSTVVNWVVVLEWGFELLSSSHVFSARKLNHIVMTQFGGQPRYPRWLQGPKP
jgi:hypothetical protein